MNKPYYARITYDKSTVTATLEIFADVLMATCHFYTVKQAEIFFYDNITPGYIIPDWLGQ